VLDLTDVSITPFVRVDTKVHLTLWALSTV
jgi:hypothetical protein